MTRCVFFTQPSNMHGSPFLQLSQTGFSTPTASERQRPLTNIRATLLVKPNLVCLTSLGGTDEREHQQDVPPAPVDEDRRRRRRVLRALLDAVLARRHLDVDGHVVRLGRRRQDVDAAAAQHGAAEELVTQQRLAVHARACRLAHPADSASLRVGPLLCGNRRCAAKFTQRKPNPLVSLW